MKGEADQLFIQQSWLLAAVNDKTDGAIKLAHEIPDRPEIAGVDALGKFHLERNQSEVALQYEVHLGAGTGAIMVSICGCAQACKLPQHFLGYHGLPGDSALGMIQQGIDIGNAQ